MDSHQDILLHQKARLEALKRSIGQEVDLGRNKPQVLIEMPKAEMPEAIEKLQERKGRLFSEMNRRHAQLPLLIDDVQRYESARHIIELEGELADCWQALDNYRESGELPQILEPAQSEEKQKDALAEKSDIELVRLRNNARAYISKNRGNPKKERQVAERQSLLEKLETMIG